MAYFPNGSSFDIWERDNCAVCMHNGSGEHGDPPCPLLGASFEFNYDQLKRGQEKLRGALSMIMGDGVGPCPMRLKNPEPEFSSDEPLARELEEATDG